MKLNQLPIKVFSKYSLSYKIVFSIYIIFLITLIISNSLSAKELSQEQIKQIEDIAQTIASQSNSNKQAMLDDITVSFNATSVGRNVIFENIIRVRKGLSSENINKWIEATRSEILPKACAQNKDNPAFDRGLSYTFSYSNTYGEKLGEVFVDKATCNSLGL